MTPDLGQIMLGGTPEIQRQQAYRQWLDARRGEILAQLMNGNQFAAPEADPGIPAAPAKVVVPDWPSQFAEIESVQAPQPTMLAGGAPIAAPALEALMNPQQHVSPGFSFPPGLGPLEIVGDPTSSDPIKRRFGQAANMVPGKLSQLETGYTDAPAVPVSGQRAAEVVPATPAAMSPSFTISPDMYPFLLAAGAELMQPMPIWQTSAGHFGRAMQAGFGATQAQRQGEMDLRAKQAQIDQNVAATEQTREATKNLPQEGRRTSAQADLLLKELENYDQMSGLKVKEIEARIDQAKKEGVLTEARANALKKDLQLKPEYQDAVIRELNARAQYYRNGGSRASAGGDTSMVKNKDELKRMFIGQGMSDAEAEARAWELVLPGAREEAKLVKSATRMLGVWERAYKTAKADGKSKGTLEEYVGDRAELLAETGTGDNPRIAAEALSIVQQRAERAAAERSGLPGSAREPEQKSRATPVPIKRNADGRPVFDKDKMVPGTLYRFPDGSEAVWSGK